MGALTKRRILLLLSLFLNMFPLSPCSIPPARAGQQCATNPGGGTVSPNDLPGCPGGLIFPPRGEPDTKCQREGTPSTVWHE